MVVVAELLEGPVVVDDEVEEIDELLEDVDEVTEELEDIDEDDVDIVDEVAVLEIVVVLLDVDGRMVKGLIRFWL